MPRRKFSNDIAAILRGKRPDDIAKKRAQRLIHQMKYGIGWFDPWSYAPVRYLASAFKGVDTVAGGAIKGATKSLARVTREQREKDRQFNEAMAIYDAEQAKLDAKKQRALDLAYSTEKTEKERQRKIKKFTQKIPKRFTRASPEQRQRIVGKVHKYNVRYPSPSAPPQPVQSLYPHLSSLAYD